MPPNQNPEQIARDAIDAQLRSSGWAVQNKDGIDFHAGEGQAVREYATDSGPADYVLFVDGQPVGVIEAKKETLGQNLTVAEDQTSDYAAAKLIWVQATGLPLPFLYEATRRLPIALPSLPEQQEIVRQLDEQIEAIEWSEWEFDDALQRSEARRLAILRSSSATSSPKTCSTNPPLPRWSPSQTRAPIGHTASRSTTRTCCTKDRMRLAQVMSQPHPYT